MAKCKQPDGNGNFCVAQPGNHATCMDGNGHVWDNPNFQSGARNRHLDPDKRRTIEIITEAVKNTEPEHRAGPINTGVPPEAVEAWTKTPEGRAWIDGAYRELVALSQRVEQFTTPEHLWPLLDAPREKRALSQAVQRAIQRNEIAEVGAKRLREVYHSRDGVRFPMNKLVPIYQRA